MLNSLWPLKRQRILDFGCGFGDLYGFLQEEGIKADYLGVDINETLIRAGLGKYPNARLQVLDVISAGFPEGFDYIFASGVFNFHLPDNWGFIQKIFALAAQAAKRGFAANFLSAQASIRYADSYY